MESGMKGKKDYLIYHRRYGELKKQGKTGWVDEEAPNFPIHLEAIKRVYEQEGFPHSGQALDLGCGAGCWSFQLEKLGFEVTGFDLSPFAIEWARERAKEKNSHCQFICDNILHYDDFEPASFDLILDGFLLHCLIGNDRLVYLNKAHKLLKRGGTFLIQTFYANDLSAPDWKDWHINPDTRLQTNKEGIIEKYIGTESSIIDDIESAGFTVESCFSIPIGGGMLEITAKKN
jgi:SAM-dependent methyltransferase